MAKKYLSLETEECKTILTDLTKQVLFIFRPFIPTFFYVFMRLCFLEFIDFLKCRDDFLIKFRMFSAIMSSNIPSFSLSIPSLFPAIAHTSNPALPLCVCCMLRGALHIIAPLLIYSFWGLFLLIYLPVCQFFLLPVQIYCRAILIKKNQLYYVFQSRISIWFFKKFLSVY